MVFILQGTSWLGYLNASMQVFESLSMEMESTSKFSAKLRVVKAQGEEDLTFKRNEETLMYKITYKIIKKLHFTSLKF